MRRLTFLSIAIVLAAAVQVWAGEERPNPAPNTAPNPYGARVKAAPGGTLFSAQAKSPAQWYIDSLDPVVGLTDQQKKAITEVIENRDKAMREFQSKNAEKLAAASKVLGEGYQKNDKEAAAKGQKAYQEAYAPFHQIMKESQKKLDDILTPQQKEKQTEHQMATWIKVYTDPIVLSEEQKQKAKIAYREMQKASDHGLWDRNAPDAILKILTPQQRTALNKHRLGSYAKAMFARVNLTDEQNKKIDALLDKVCQDPKLSADWKTYQSVNKQVEEFLTAEQKETLKKPFQAWNQAGGSIGRNGTFTYSGSGALVVPGAAPGNALGVSPYWIGLSVEAGPQQGLVVRAVSPESPAAKAGIKVNDVIVSAGDTALKSVPDLVKAVAQAKEKELGLTILRDRKQQKVSVKPAKRPTEGVFLFQTEGAGEKANVRPLPGGDMQVIIGEGNENAQAKAVIKSLTATLEQAVASSQANMGERIKRQHELAEKAWQTYQKIQSLGDKKKGEAHELWEQIESLEGQLRQTFEPARGSVFYGRPVAPAGGVLNLAPGAPANGGWIQVMPRGQLAPGQSLPGQALPGQACPGQPATRPMAVPVDRGQAAALQELRTQVEQLRRDVQELKAQAKKKDK